MIKFSHEAIKRLRAESGMTAKEFAFKFWGNKNTHLTENYFVNRNITVNSLIQLAEIFKVPVQTFFEGNYEEDNITGNNIILSGNDASRAVLEMQNKIILEKDARIKDLSDNIKDLRKQVEILLYMDKNHINNKPTNL